MIRIAAIMFLSLALAGGAELQLPMAQSAKFAWDAQRKQLSGSVEALPLKEAMARLAGATGWKVYLDPAAERNISAQFSGRAPGEALRLMLGNLSFAVLPQKDGKSKLYVFKNAMSDATEEVEATAEKRGKDWLPKEVIVTLAKGSGKDIEELSRLLGAKVVGRNDRLRTYRLEFDSDEAAEAARQRLASSPDLRVDDNYALRSPDDGGDPGAVGAPRFELRPNANADGSHTVVAVVDTAVQPLDAAKNAFLLPPVDVLGAADPAQLASVTPLHGTSMVETLLNSLMKTSEGSGESGVRILPVNVYGNRDSTTTFDVTLGVYEAARRGADVINLSLGGEASSPLLDDLIIQARKQGILFFAAAGNSPTTAPTYPAANPLVYAVTAGDRNGAIAPYANKGGFIDLIAPGTSYINYGGQTFRVMGTSPATAGISGVAAAHLSAGKSLQEVEAAIRSSFALPK